MSRQTPRSQRFANRHAHALPLVHSSWWAELAEKIEHRAPIRSADEFWNRLGLES